MSTVKTNKIKPISGTVHLDSTGNISVANGITVGQNLTAHQMLIPNSSTFRQINVLGGNLSCNAVPTLASHVVNKKYLEDFAVTPVGSLVYFYAFSGHINPMNHDFILPGGEYTIEADMIYSNSMSGGNGGNNVVITFGCAYRGTSVFTSSKTIYYVNSPGTCGSARRETGTISGTGAITVPAGGYPYTVTLTTSVSGSSVFDIYAQKIHIYKA
jgi:hypothetical protein